MPIDNTIGDCPPFTGGAPEEFRACIAERDAPQDLVQGSVESSGEMVSVPTAGFRFRGIVQFFSIGDDVGVGFRKHSCLEFWWNSTCQLASIWLDNYKTDIVPVILWGAVGAPVGADVPKQRHEEDMFLDGCPVFPPNPPPPLSSCESIPDSSSGSSGESSGESSCEIEQSEHETAGCIVRVMALRGSYGETSSSSSQPSGSSDPTACNITKKIYYKPDTFICGNYDISEIDPTLGDIATELAMEFGSTGLLTRVYWGGFDVCDDNPCVWDVNADSDKPGVVVPVIQFVNDEQNNNYRIWQIHFDSTGRYLKSCQYALLCGCSVGVSSSEGELRCPCISEACIYLPDCIETIHYRPPEFVYFTCAEALDVGRNENCPSSSQENKFCEYVHTEGACTGSEALFSYGEGSILDEMGPPPGNARGCLYLSGFPLCE